MRLKDKLLYVAAAMTLVACSNDGDLDGAQCLASFSGSIAGQSSTRMAGTAWDMGDSIGISATSPDKATVATNVKYSTADGDGVFSAAVAANAITFGSTGKVTFSAYYPYNANGGTVTVSTAAANQASDKQKGIDFLYATASANIALPDVKFKFSHVMSQLVLNIKAGLGIDDLSKLTCVNLGNIKLNGTFNTASGETSATGTASSIALTPSIASGKKEYTASLIFLPQTVTNNKLSLTLTYNDIEYAATLTLAEGLVAGNSTVYDVTLDKTSVSVSGGSINPWNSSNLSTEATEVPDYFVSAEDAELYALAFTDGTYLNIWDTENNDIDEGMWSIYERTDKKVCGLVYWLSTTDRTPLTYDKLLEAEHPECTHGYILALNDASSNSGVWQETADPVYEWYQKNLLTVSSSTSFQSIVIDKTDSEQLNKTLGYNNTRILMCYNDAMRNTNSSYLVKPAEAIEQYSALTDETAPKGSSGWYLPSPKELAYVMASGIDIIEFSYIRGNSTHRERINSILNKIETGSPVKTVLYPESDMVSHNAYYWTSSEVVSRNIVSASIVSVYLGRIMNADKTCDWGAGSYTRAVCAF